MICRHFVWWWERKQRNENCRNQWVNRLRCISLASPKVMFFQIISFFVFRCGEHNTASLFVHVLGFSHLKSGKEGVSSHSHQQQQQHLLLFDLKLRFLHRMTFVFQTSFLIFAKGSDRGYSWHPFTSNWMYELVKKHKNNKKYQVFSNPLFSLFGSLFEIDICFFFLLLL